MTLNAMVIDPDTDELIGYVNEMATVPPNFFIRREGGDAVERFVPLIRYASIQALENLEVELAGKVMKRREVMA